MAGPIKSLNDQNLRRAMDDNNVEFWTTYGDYPGGYFKNDRGVAWSIPNINFVLYNCFLRCRLSEDNFQGEAENFMHLLKKHRLSASWWLNSYSKPDRIPEMLGQLGWQRYRRSPAMAVEVESITESPDIPGLNFEIAENERKRKLWAEILNSSVGLNQKQVFEAVKVELKLKGPKYNSQYRYLGYLFDEPVATGLLNLSSGLAGIYCIATIPRARKMGIGTAITLKAIEHSRELGYKVAVLTSSEMGYNVYKRIGFEDIFAYSNYLWHP